MTGYGIPMPTLAEHICADSFHQIERVASELGTSGRIWIGEKGIPSSWSIDGGVCLQARAKRRSIAIIVTSVHVCLRRHCRLSQVVTASPDIRHIANVNAVDTASP
jgi:hypothetical protein